MLVNASSKRNVSQIAYYTIHLEIGQSIRCISIKAATISKYIAAVAKVHNKLNGFDPQYFGRKPSNVTNPPINSLIKCILDELKRWE